MKETRFNCLIKAKRRFKNLRLIDDLISKIDGQEFETNYSNNYPDDLELGKENIDKHETSFWDIDSLDIRIRDGKFRVVILIMVTRFLFISLECLAGQVIDHLPQFIL